MTITKRIKWTFLAIGIIEFLFLVIIFSTSRYTFNLANSMNECKEKYEILKYEKRINSIRINKELFTEELVLGNFTFNTLENETCQVNNIISDYKLIYRFTPKSCNTCVENDILILNQLCDSIGFDKVLLIGEYDNINKLKVFKYESGIRFSCFNYTRRLGLPIEEDENDAPFFFIVDKSLRIHLAHHSSPEYNFGSPYFQRILLFFKESRQ